MKPIVVELDPGSWEHFHDRMEAWFGNVLLLQSTFRRMAHDAVRGIPEPHVKQYVHDIAQKADEHVEAAETCYRLIGRQPSATRKLGGLVLSQVRETAASLQGLMGGASGSWKQLRGLLLANMDSMGAFAVVEQLGLSLAIPALVDHAFVVVQEKHVHHLVLQELMLEFASVSVLYDEKVATPTDAS